MKLFQYNNHLQAAILRLEEQSWLGGRLIIWVTDKNGRTAEGTCPDRTLPLGAIICSARTLICRWNKIGNGVDSTKPVGAK